MDFFNIAKKFETCYIQGAASDGTMNVSDDHKMKVLQKKDRKGKGKEYVESFSMDSDPEEDDIEEDAASCIGDLECTTAGTGVNINELNAEKMSNIYKEYYENKEEPKCKLVIMNYKKKILSLIETNEVVILTGPTGCGKTTQVPQFILDSHVNRNKYCNIIITQPRRIAAISVAKRVSEERGWQLGSLCGYKIGLKNCTSEDTLLTYVTTDVLLQSLIRKKSITPYTHIILDEVHERGQSVDFSLLVLKKLLKRTQNVKVILMSATMQAMKFANYFQKSYLNEFQYAPIIKIEHSTNLPVQIHYLEELSALGTLPDIKEEDPRISESSYDICIRLIKMFEKIDTDETFKNAVLVFLPGIYDIEYLYAKLNDPKVHSSGTVQYKWLLLPLHSQITIEEQAQAFLPAPTGYRKIILSTNIAESSITVSGIKFVIDFCLTKSLRLDSYTNFCSLQLCWASKANCIQRAGRVGRVMEGKVYRMVYKEFYEGLEEEGKPEIQVAPLDKVVLQAKMLEMGEPRAILASALDPPDLLNIEWTILNLKEAGGLLRTQDGRLTPYDGDLTFLGRLMAILPVDIHITRLIVLGHLFSCLEECIIMGACMSLKSIFSYPFNKKLQAYNSKLDWADGSFSDCIAFLNVYEVWCNNHLNGYFKRSRGENETMWAKKHFIQLRVLKEVKLLVEELTFRLKENLVEESVGYGKVKWKEYEKALVLKIVIAGAFYPNYFGRGLLGGKVDEKDAVQVIGGRNPFTTVFLRNFPVDQPIVLYTQLIKDALSGCKDDMKVSHDSGGKIYVEFRNRNVKSVNKDMPFGGILPGKIPIAVYRAIKLRQCEKFIDIKVLPVDMARERAAALGIKYQKGLLKQEVESKTSGTIQNNLPGIDVSHIPLNITHVVDPGQFWAYNLNDFNNQKQIFEALNTLDDELERFDKSPPSTGELCIAPFEENRETWYYRARVEALTKRGENKMAEVFFIDYGNSAVVDVKQLKRFSPELMEFFEKIPAQAFECRLSKIGPSLIMNPKGNWSSDACATFERIIQDGKLFGSVYSVVEGVVSLELFKIDSSNTQISINEYLISEGYAEKTEESYHSKMNNEIRMCAELDICQKDDYNYLQQHDGTWDSNSVQPPEEKDLKIRVQLRGPFSPLEMQIYPYTRGALSKSVSIFDESVNSVLLDTDPQDHHERLIVAGVACQNAQGTRLLLRNTTIMPNIHGLAALIPFIFAPQVELRANKDRTRYTGMLCGLGADENGEPVFPEHDFEVYFDCEITFDDFSIINKLRFYMSRLLMTENDESHPNLSGPDIIRFQKQIKDKLLSLLNKARAPQEVEVIGREYEWGLFPCELVVNSPLAESYSEISIFPFHPGVRLKEFDQK